MVFARIGENFSLCWRGVGKQPSRELTVDFCLATLSFPLERRLCYDGVVEGFNPDPSGRQTMSANISTQTTVGHLLPPETLVETNGAGPAYELGALEGKPVIIVLDVTEIIEQESLHVSVWSSADGKAWGQQALFWFPQKFYAGSAPAALDLKQLPGVKFLQARWEVNRWGRGDPRPLFKFGVEIQELVS
jgi:hypothetical protein